MAEIYRVIYQVEDLIGSSFVTLGIYVTNYNTCSNIHIINVSKYTKVLTPYHLGPLD